jgi:hypothetical protein
MGHTSVVAMSHPSRSARRFPALIRAFRRGVLPLVLLIAPHVTHTTAAAESRFPLSISAGTQSLTVPWHPGPATNRFNPAFVVGTDRTWKPVGGARLYYTFNVGVFQNYWWMTGVFLDAELGIGHALPLGFQADLRLGAGYLHYYWRRETLVLEDGRYVRATDWGRPSAMFPLSVILGYRGSAADPLRFAPFVSAQWAAQAPFTDEAPVMTHFFLAVGVRIDLGRETPAARR